MFPLQKIRVHNKEVGETNDESSLEHTQRLKADQHYQHEVLESEKNPKNFHLQKRQSAE